MDARFITSRSGHDSPQMSGLFPRFLEAFHTRLLQPDARNPFANVAEALGALSSVKSGMLVPSPEKNRGSDVGSHLYGRSEVQANCRSSGKKAELSGFNLEINQLETSESRVLEYKENRESEGFSNSQSHGHISTSSVELHMHCRSRGPMMQTETLDFGDMKINQSGNRHKVEHSLHNHEGLASTGNRFTAIAGEEGLTQVNFQKASASRRAMSYAVDDIRKQKVDPAGILYETWEYGLAEPGESIPLLSGGSFLKFHFQTSDVHNASHSNGMNLIAGDAPSIWPPHKLLSKKSKMKATMIWQRRLMDTRHTFLKQGPPSEKHYLQKSDRSEDDGKLRVMKQLLCGGFAGVISRTTVAPLDLIKTHLITAHGMQGARKSALTICQEILKQDGWKGLFRGNTVNCIRVAPNKAIELCVFEMVRRSLNKEGHPLQKLAATIAGGAAGMAGTIVTYPLELIRTRLSVQPELYKGLLQAVSKIAKEEGLGAFYSGLRPSLVGVFPYAATNYFVYDGLRTVYCQTTGHQNVPTTHTLLFGALAAAASSTVTYPLEVARRQMQLGRIECFVIKKRTIDILKEIFRQEGFFALYRGLGTTWLKLVPAAGISFVCYEAARIALQVDDASLLKLQGTPELHHEQNS